MRSTAVALAGSIIAVSLAGATPASTTSAAAADSAIAPSAAPRAPFAPTVHSVRVADTFGIAPQSDTPGKHYSYLAKEGSRIVRWDPCIPHTYKLNPAGHPVTRTELARARSAFAQVGKELGITFVYKGLTLAAVDQVPSQGDS